MKKNIVIIVIVILLALTGGYIYKLNEKKETTKKQENLINEIVTCRNDSVQQISNITDLNFLLINADVSTVKEALVNKLEDLQNLRKITSEYEKCLNVDLSILEKDSNRQNGAKEVKESIEQELKTVQDFNQKYDQFMNKRVQFLKLLENINEENYFAFALNFANYTGKNYDQILKDIPNNFFKVTEAVLQYSNDFTKAIKDILFVFTEPNSKFNEALNNFNKGSN